MAEFQPDPATTLGGTWASRATAGGGAWPEKFSDFFLGFSGYFPTILSGVQCKNFTRVSGLNHPVVGISRFSTGFVGTRFSEIRPLDLRLVCPIGLLKFKNVFGEV